MGHLQTWSQKEVCVLGAWSPVGCTQGRGSVVVGPSCEDSPAGSVVFASRLFIGLMLCMLVLCEWVNLLSLLGLEHICLGGGLRILDVLASIFKWIWVWTGFDGDFSSAPMVHFFSRKYNAFWCHFYGNWWTPREQILFLCSNMVTGLVEAHQKFHSKSVLRLEENWKGPVLNFYMDSTWVHF